MILILIKIKKENLIKIIKKNKEIKIKLFKTIIIAINNSNINNNKKFILNFETIKHYIPYKNWLLNFKFINNKFIIITNN